MAREIAGLDAQQQMQRIISSENTSSTAFDEGISPGLPPSEEIMEPLRHDSSFTSFTVEDFELQHHFLTSHCLGLIENGGNESFWASEVFFLCFVDH